MENLLVPQDIDRVHPEMPSAEYNPKKHQTTSERKNEPMITLPKNYCRVTAITVAVASP
jgi:hypothetical protein